MRAWSIERVAAAAGAADLFLFRKIGDGRFAHIGGAGRGEGWAGIVEVGIGEEPFLCDALAADGVTRRSRDEPWRVFGPYYARSVAVSPASKDAFVVFGSSEEGRPDAGDAELSELASVAQHALREVTAAKRLADELEVLNALRDLLLSPAATFDEALRSVVTQAAAALSCDLGVVYVRDGGRVAVSDPDGALRLDGDALREVLEAIDRRGEFPVCIQDAASNELPHPFSASDGAIAYYLLELGAPVGGFLLLLHTAAAPRGFTLLCQTLGERLVEAASPFLAAALARDGLRDDLERAAAEARRDVLTGAANRLAWDEALAAASNRSGRPVSIVQIDCRGLKRANDTYGHQAGDRLLRRAAEIASAAVRADDLVARIGGDEFAILLRNADEFVARDIVKRIEQAVDSEPPIEMVDLALAIGCATTRDGKLVAAQHAADRCMLAAKEIDRSSELEASL
jgi:diguanylate cyclase (GGDEF)-like protein